MATSSLPKADPPLKRALSNPEVSDPVVDIDLARVRALNLELRRQKKRIRKLNTRISVLERTSQDQTSVLSVIERSWSQLEDELNELIGNQPQSLDSTQVNHVLELYTRSNQAYLNRDPTDLNPLRIQLLIDEWCTETDIERERERLLTQHLESIDMNSLQSNVLARINTTRSMTAELIQRLAQTGVTEASLDGFLDRQALKGEALAYRDMCISLREALINSKVDLTLSDLRQRKLERMLISEGAEANDSQRQIVQSQCAEESPRPSIKRVKREEIAEQKEHPPQFNGDNSWQGENAQHIAELELQVNTLNRQLASAQAASEQTQAQFAAADSLRVSAEQRVMQLDQECQGLRRQFLEMEGKVNECYSQMNAKLEQSVNEQSTKIQQLSAERDLALQQLSNAQGTQELVTSLREQIAEYEELHKAQEQQLATAQQHHQRAQTNISTLTQELDGLRNRERQLQLQLASSITRTESGIDEALADAQQQTISAQAQSQDLSNQMNDLFAEIEGIAADNKKLRAQNKKLVQKIGIDGDRKIAMSHEMEQMRTTTAAAQSHAGDLERRVQALKGLLEREEAYRDSVKVRDFQIQQQFLAFQDALAHSQQELFGLGQQFRIAASTVDQQREELRRNTALNQELTESVNRLQRRVHEQQQELAQQQMLCSSNRSDQDNTDAAESRALDGTERQIFEKLRGMLKCSVCENRFKNTVIVRCGHMFCDQCVDSSLKSRNRKCPACKEKFGQDDIRRVYLS